MEAKVLPSAYQEDVLVKKKKKSEEINEHNEKKILDSTEVEGLLLATDVKDYCIHVDRWEETVIPEDFSASPLESDQARLLKNKVVEGTNSLNNLSMFCQTALLNGPYFVMSKSVEVGPAYLPLRPDIR